MKALLIVFLVSVQVLMGAAAGTAAPTVVTDYRSGANTYWGGYYPFNNEDAVGTRDINYQWDITKMEIEEVGSKIQVKIYGPWFGAQSASWYFTKENTGGTKPWAGNLYYNLGDLYISSPGWKISNPDPPGSLTKNSPNDTFIANPADPKFEGWDYVITHRNGTFCYNSGDYGCVGNVYKLDYTNITTTTTRTLQAYAGGYGEKVEGVSVYVYGYQDPNKPLDESDQSYIFYEFDKFLTGDIGFHHTMGCGNDVIEGQAHITPEPGTLLLLGLGLVGVAACRRRAGK